MYGWWPYIHGWQRRFSVRRNGTSSRGGLKLYPNKVVKNWDGAESKTRPSNLTDTNLNQSELTRDTYLVRVNPHKSSSNSVATASWRHDARQGIMNVLWIADLIENTRDVNNSTRFHVMRMRAIYVVSLCNPYYFFVCQWQLIVRDQRTDIEYTGLPDVAIYRQSGDKIVYYGPREWSGWFLSEVQFVARGIFCTTHRF
jgi:hypothetical protein